MGQYANEEKVKVRVRGKVRFTDSEDDDESDNKMGTRLLRTLIKQAEGEVELELSPRFSAPFTTDTDGPFADLPAMTKNVLQSISEMKCVMLILETDFGSGSSTDSSKYTEALQKRYDKVIERCIGRRKVDGSESMQFAYPPLPGLKLNYQNEMADDGFMGQIHVTSSGDGDFPGKQINDPGETFWNGALDF